MPRVILPVISPSVPQTEPTGHSSVRSANFDGRQLILRQSGLPREALLVDRHAHEAKMGGVRMSLGTAADRLDYLARMGVTPERVVNTATCHSSVPIQHPNAGNIQFQLGRMRVDTVELPDRASRHDLPTCKALDAIPLALPDRDEPHTINTGKYLANRISSAVAEHARHHGCEFFCGGSHATMLDYYRGKGFDRAVEISSNTSTRAHLLASSSNGKSTLVLSGMSSETRIKHQLLQLHFAGVDLNRIHLVGEIGAQKAQAKQSLGTVLSQLPSADSRTLFIGARWQIMEYLGKQIHGIADERPEGEGYAKLAPREHKVDSFMFDTARFSLDGRQHLVAALRMPNGDLAYDATKVFLEHGFNHVVMCGAGGRLAGELQVGDYMLLGQSQYGGENFSVARECIQVPYAGIFSDRKLNSNVTVDSPLQETERWLKENHATGSVDVETAHIFRALHERGSGIKVIPGLFVSDVVGAHPLEGKISTADAYRNLSEFVAATLRSIREHDSISTA